MALHSEFYVVVGEMSLGLHINSASTLDTEHMSSFFITFKNKNKYSDKPILQNLGN